MTRTLNGAAVAFANLCLTNGKIDKTSDWSFSADDGNSLLGSDNDWANYGKHFLALNTGETEKTKAYFSYPFAKAGTVYRSGLIAVKQRAAAQGDDTIEAAAGRLLDKIDGKAAPAANCRAYSVLKIRSVDAAARVIKGVATTPSVDRYGDIIEPKGVTFKNPLPLLWQHDATMPVGQCTFDPATDDGITFEAQFAIIDTPGQLKDSCDYAWQAVQANLVRAVSIGFLPDEWSVMDTGYRFITSEVVELSLVTIPANADATITSIRSIDTAIRAAAGKRTPVVRATKPSVVGTVKPTVKVTKESKEMKKSLAEQIAQFTSTRATSMARMDEIMQEAAERGETLDAEKQEEYDTLDGELKTIDQHVARLKAHELRMVSAATAVDPAVVVDPAAGAHARSTTLHAQVRATPKVPAGRGFTRFVLAMARAKGNPWGALEHVKSNEQWRAETPDVELALRSAVSAGTTTDSAWAGPLVPYQNLTSEFIEFLRPMTIIGRIPGLRNVPFKVKIPRQTGASSVGWVGEGQVKPVSALAFDSLTLDIATISGIVTLTEQLIRYSTPAAEALVQADLAASVVQFMDQEFVDPTNAATGVSPASITNGVTPIVASGTDTDHMRTDIGNLISVFLEANLNLNSAVWIMSQVTAARINLIRNALGQKEYPDINAMGGMFEGFPVVTSQSVVAQGGSPTDGWPIILANAGDILLADEGQVRIDASSEASLQMDNSPDSPPTASTTMVSMFQSNMVAIRADRDINWVKRRSTAVQYISSANYTTG